MDEGKGHNMKDLLLYIAKNLVENPDAVSVTEVEGEQELTLELRVASEDMGKVPVLIHSLARSASILISAGDTQGL